MQVALVAGMGIVLWITQSVLAALLLVSGYRRMTQHKGAGGLFVSTRTLGETAAAFVGAFEWLLAVLLLLPKLLRTHSGLTAVSALGLACLMVGAAGVHVVGRNYRRSAGPLLVCALALFVVFGTA